mgnify:CR=1 FL=1
MFAIAQNKQGLGVLGAGAILQLFLGIVYVWGVFVIPVSEFYRWDIADVKLTTSYMLSFFVVGILIGGKLQMKIGPSKTVLFGGMLLAAGMFATAFVPYAHAGLLYVTYGIVGGFGVGVGYNTIISAAQKWFPKNRGFATGLSVCAFGFSTVVFAPLIEALIRHFGLRNTFLILAGSFFVVVLALFHCIKTPDESVAPDSASSALLTKKQYTMTEMLKTKEFYWITLSLMFTTTTFFILNPSFKTFAIERGMDPSIGTVVVMLTGVANALGRLGVPFLSDKIGREKTALAIITATGLCALLLCVAGGVLFMAAIAVIAFCFGGSSGIYPVITADYFGIKNVGSNYGAVMVGFAISALAFPMLIGFIGNTTAKFIVLAAIAAVGAGLLTLLIRSKKKA